MTHVPGPDPVGTHARSVALVRGLDAGDLARVGELLGELAGPEEFAAQVVSLAGLARLLLDERPGGDRAGDRDAVLARLAGVLAAAEGPAEP